MPIVHAEVAAGIGCYIGVQCTLAAKTCRLLQSAIIHESPFTALTPKLSRLKNIPLSATNWRPNSVTGR